jgi:serine protease Do
MRKNRVKIFVRILVLTWAFVLAAGTGLTKENSAALNMARQLNQAFIEVADSVSPAVVVIKVAHKRDATALEDEENPLWDLIPRQFRKQFEEQREKQKREGGERSREPVFDSQGSGVVIREEGYILTNRHVVDGAEKIQVRFKDESQWYDAEIRGVDSQSDVAVIKIDVKGKKLTVAKLGDSEKTRVGEFAIAIGAPFELDYSVTFGHVSAKGRSGIINDPAMDQDFIQTDANINPGNSGGPLVNIDGEVIGINTLIRGLRTGIGFAIPINLAKEISSELVTKGKYVRSWLGIGIRALKDHTEYREMIPGVNDGVVVTQIQPDGPAAKSDLKPTDVITAVDGKPVATAQQLKNEIRSKKIGQNVTLDVYRKGKNIKIKVKPDAWPDEAIPVAHSRLPSEEEGTKNLGLTVRSLSRELADQFGVEKIEGVIVTEVEQGSPAARVGLRPGDIITEVNYKPVTTPKEFRDALKSGDPKKGHIINFTSRGTSKFEILKDSGD